MLRPGLREHFTLLDVAGGCGRWIGFGGGGGGGGGELVGKGEGGRGEGGGGRGKGGEWMMQLGFIIL